MHGLVFLAMILLAGMPAPVQAQELGDPEAGATYAREICAQCPAVLSDDHLSPKPDAPPFGAGFHVDLYINGGTRFVFAATSMETEFLRCDSWHLLLPTHSFCR